MEISTKSASQTQAFGKKIGNYLIHRFSEKVFREDWGSRAVIAALSGELGSGKTTFAQGFIQALGIHSRVLSPTFVMSREYPLRLLHFTRLYHIDLYRIEKVIDLESLGLTDIFQNPSHIVLIEWAQRLGTLLPEKYFDIRFHIENDQHVIKIKNLEV